MASNEKPTTSCQPPQPEEGSEGSNPECIDTVIQDDDFILMKDTDLKQVRLPLGEKEYYVFSCDGKNMTLLFKQYYRYASIIQTSTTKDTEPHYPEIGDMVLVRQGDHWYRAAVLSKLDSEDIAHFPDYDDIYLIEYVDFGKTQFVIPCHIRKFPRRCANLPMLAVQASIIGVEKEDILLREKISNSLPDGTCAKMNIKSDWNEGEYYGVCVEIPLIPRLIRNIG